VLAYLRSMWRHQGGEWGGRGGVEAVWLNVEVMKGKAERQPGKSMNEWRLFVNERCIAIRPTRSVGLLSIDNTIWGFFFSNLSLFW